MLLNLVVILLLWKELKISSFDPALSTSMGFSATLMHYLLMALVAVTTVASFEAVGSILVVAMLIVPAATAQLLCDRLGHMVVLACVFAILSAVVGYWLALPGKFAERASRPPARWPSSPAECTASPSCSRRNTASSARSSAICKRRCASSAKTCC